LPGIYLANMTTPPLSLGIQHMESMMRQSGATVSGDAVGMATSFLIMVPPMILFIFTQRWFIEGVERTGLVE
jgi:multiple sugar transport system permease protein